MVAWRSQFQPVSPLSRTADLPGLCFPDGIMVVLSADQRMGNLMENGVFDVFIGAVADEIKRDGDDPIVIVAAAGAPGAVIKLKVPFR